MIAIRELLWPLKSLLLWALVLGSNGIAHAQPTAQGDPGAMCNCPMHGMDGMQGWMGPVVMTLAVLFFLAVIGVLVALIVFLIRRSRPTGPAPG